MHKLIGSLRLAVVFLYTVLVFLFVLLLLPVLRDRSRASVMRFLARTLPAILGVKFVVKGRVPDEAAVLDGRRSGPGYMVCSNHVSFLDIFVLHAVLPVRFVAKKEIASWPVFGRIASGVGTIFIDRSRRRAVLEVAEVMSKAINEGTNVLFFPEGTTGRGDKLLPFYANLFSAACESGCEILPVTVRYTLNGETTTLCSYADAPLFDVMKRIASTPGLGVEVTVLDAVSSFGRDRRELCAEVSRDMAAVLGVPDATAERDAKVAARRAACAAPHPTEAV